MHIRHEAADWSQYKMNMREPHNELEPIEQEIAVVDAALQALVEAGVLPTSDYEKDLFLAFRNAVKENFEIPWTAISPRVQRLIWAVNAIHQPQNLIAVGVFCGFTFISNAGAAIGPGAAFDADRVIGIEINEDDAALAQRNVSSIDPTGKGQVLAVDGVQWLRDDPEPVDLLYLDATAPGEEGKSLYLRLLQAALPRMKSGSLVLAHNSQNAADSLQEYLQTVRDPAQFGAGINCVLDDQGLEVSSVK